jgi:hypothetical protein
VKTPYPTDTAQLATEAPTDVVYDAVIIGGGMGGLTTAAKLVAKGAKVVVLEKYLVPGGSAAHYKREGYTFDVGSSMMFGFGDQGTTNLITKALESVGKRMKTVPDPTQVHYHCPPSSAHPEVGCVRCLHKHAAAAAAAAMSACALQEVSLICMLPQLVENVAMYRRLVVCTLLSVVAAYAMYQAVLFPSYLQQLLCSITQQQLASRSYQGLDSRLTRSTQHDTIRLDSAALVLSNVS